MSRLLILAWLASLCLTLVFGGKSALLIIDVQTCFVSGGSLAVTDGDDVIPVINRIRQQFDTRFSMVVVSQDWHCPTHVSFAASHVGKSNFDVIQLNYRQDGSLCLDGLVNSNNFPNAVTCGSGQPDVKLNQVLWPIHCVANVTSGPTSSNTVSSLQRDHNDVIIKKGRNCEIDSYSVFFDNGGLKSTGLENILRRKGVDTVFVTGLALDYCVYYTSLDAKRLGFETYTVVDAAKGVAPDTTDKAKKDMVEKGITLINSHDIGDVLDAAGNHGDKVKHHVTITVSAALVLALVDLCN